MPDTYAEPELIRVQHRHGGAYAFLAPALIVLGVFFVVPLLWMLRLSVSEYEPVTHTARTVALAHYRKVLVNPATWRSILNTVYFGAVYITLTLVLGGVIALLLRRCARSLPVLKAAVCAPCLTPVVAAALIWRAAYQPAGGAVDRFLHLFGPFPGSGWSGWLGEAYLAMPCIALMLL